MTQFKPINQVVIFTDIQGFTKLTQVLQADAFTVLNCYFEYCAAVIEDYPAQYFETVSDGWIITLEGENKELWGFRLAVELQRALMQLLASSEWKHLIRHPAWEQLREFKTRIGLHSGETVTSRIGIEHFSRNCIIGEAAEWAAMLESHNRYFQTHLLFTDTIFSHLPEAEIQRVRAVDVISNRQRHLIYTYDFSIVGDYEIFRKSYDAAIDAFLHEDYSSSLSLFKQALRLWPGDTVTQFQIQRLELLSG